MYKLLDVLLVNVKRLERLVILISTLIMAGALLADVIGREVFNQGIFGAVSVAVYAMIYCALAGFALASAEREHLRPRFADNWLPRSWDGAINRLADGATAAILVVLIYGGVQYALAGAEFDERSQTLGWPLWPIQAAIPFGFSLAAFRHIVYMCVPSLGPRRNASAHGVETENPA